MVVVGLWLWLLWVSGLYCGLDVSVASDEVDYVLLVGVDYDGFLPCFNGVVTK